MHAVSVTSSGSTFGFKVLITTAGVEDVLENTTELFDAIMLPAWSSSFPAFLVSGKR